MIAKVLAAVLDQLFFHVHPLPEPDMALPPSSTRYTKKKRRYIAAVLQYNAHDLLTNVWEYATLCHKSSTLFHTATFTVMTVSLSSPSSLLLPWCNIQRRKQACSKDGQSCWRRTPDKKESVAAPSLCRGTKLG